jgi:serine/threonine-protein kinase RsbW
MEDVKTLKVRAVLDNIPRAIEFVTGHARTTGFEDQAIYQIQVAADEACANVVEHAYANMEAGEMEVACFVDGRMFVVAVRDWGQSFDPDEIADPEINAPLEERTLGGLGLFLIRQFMEEVQYSSDPEMGNELTMRKRLPVDE